MVKPLYRKTLLPKLQLECDSFKIASEVMDAIFMVESSWEPSATRYEENFGYINCPTKFARSNKITSETETIMQKISWGLGQVMGGTARGLGYTGPLVLLSEPALNIHYACKYFAKVCNPYENLDKKIAAYNAGSVKMKASGAYDNQDYVDKVLLMMRDLKVDS